MFAAGDRVVYPLHGGAIVDAVEKREQNGVMVDYYVLRMLFENMTVAVPVANAERLGLRNVIQPEQMSVLAEVLQSTPDVQSVKSISWNRRFQLYMEWIKKGSVEEVGRVFKILSILEKSKKISVGERRLLHNTKQILQSEIMLVQDFDEKNAEAWIDAQLAGLE